MATIGNSFSLRLAQILGQHTSDYDKAALRLSSGLRINGPVDDSAGLAIAMSLNTSQRLADRGTRNLNEGLSLLNVASDSLTHLTSINSRLRELSLSAQVSTLSASDRSALQSEADALINEFNRIVTDTKYNDISLLDSSVTFVGLQSASGSNGIVPIFLPEGDGSASITVTVTVTVPETPGQGDGTFYAPATFAVGLGGRDVASGDFDGDGVIDLIAINDSSNNLSVLIGNGNGSFKAGICYAVGNEPSDVVSSDIDGDGKLDLIITEYTADQIAVLIGNGNGSFKAAVTYRSGDGPLKFTVGDFNGDNNLDVATANDITSNVTVLLGNGDGSFKALVTYSASSLSQSINAADINGDGKLDLVEGGSSSGSLSILLGNGDGTFKARISAPLAFDFYDAKVADINGDGKLDVVAVDTFGGGTRLAKVLLGNGNGTFKAGVSYNVSSTPYGVILGDFNGDSKVDIITANNGSRDITVLLGNGDGTFQSQITYKAGEVIQLMATDLNSDGIDDIITANNADDRLTVLLGNGTAGTPATTTSYSSTVTTYGSIALDLVDLSTITTAAAAQSVFDQMAETLAAGAARVGSSISRIGYALNFTENTELVAGEAYSKIVSLDVAQEISRLTAASIRRDTASALLAQANQSAFRVLALIAGTG